MPLIRKPGPPTAPAVRPDVHDVLEGLGSSNPEERWSAARAATGGDGNSVALGNALRREGDPRVREAIFMALARIGTQESVDELVSVLRSDDASLRTGALDALRIIVRASGALLPRLLGDPDADVRLLSCELTRGLPAQEATTLLSALLMVERQSNVCAAAVDVLAEAGNATALPALAECAKRFFDTPFLVFAIKVTMERISAQSPPARG
jgi:HEAT repeat protein